MKKCHQCGGEWLGEKRQPGFKECCESCSAYLHVCLNCRFHAPHAHNQCQSPTSEWVGDRKKANFCGEFEFRDVTQLIREDSKKEVARASLEDLFGEEEKKTPGSLDELFGD